ncbi:MAG: thiamine-phosphate synthase family protein [Dehalococcoidales bacterium]|nr:thiamine-phosphate synthase family protein [Dehalococcoidales bacterium]
MNQTKEADIILGNLVSAVNLLQACPEFTHLIPEVRVNLAYALAGAKTSQDVAAVDGRITAVRGLPHAAGMPAWGASDHLARRLLEVRKYDAQANAAINFKCNQEIIGVVQRYCSERGLLFGWLDRSEEPKGVSGQDGASMPWKVKQLFLKYGAIPRLSYEGTGWGKEPLFLALDRDAIEVVTIAIEIAHRYRAGTVL